MNVERKVRDVLADGEWWGVSELMHQAGLRPWRSGSVFAALARMEANGAAESRWVEGPYPRRRLSRQLASAETG
jgi:hypothetical protein